MGFHMVPLLKRRVWRFFRAGPNGPSPPTHFWQQNSAIPPPSSLQHDLLEIQCSHWLKLLHSDWRENLVKDFFVKIDFPPMTVSKSSSSDFWIYKILSHTILFKSGTTQWVRLLHKHIQKWFFIILAMFVKSNSKIYYQSEIILQTDINFPTQDTRRILKYYSKNYPN